MELVANIDRERSLDAVWCAYLTSHSVAENVANNRTGVVHAFFNARYYADGRGKFLSEDPVFLGNPKDQNLNDPQSLNSYSYANDNPIAKSDPTGNCAGPLIIPCLGIIGANLGIWGTYGGGVLQKLADGSPDPYAYTLSYGQIGTAGTLGFVESALLPEKRVASGLYAAGSSLAMDYVSGDTLDPVKAGIAGLTGFATGKFIPGSKNALLDAQSKVSNGIFQNASILVTTNWTNIQSAQQRAYFQSVSTQSRYQAVQGYNAATGATSPQSQLWTTPNGAVINWGGVVIAPASGSRSK